jgi:glycerol uptake facilitator-like aquaporin
VRTWSRHLHAVEAFGEFLLVLLYSGLGLQVAAEAARLTGRLATAPGYGLAAVGTFVQTTGAVIAHDGPLATLCAALTAYYLHRWWHSGGGTGKRRRLRDLRKFLGTRRTAPSTT